MGFTERVLLHRIAVHRWTPSGAKDAWGKDAGAFEPSLDPPHNYDTPALMQQRSGRTRTPEGELVVVNYWEVAVEPDLAIAEQDRITWGGRRFKIDTTRENHTPRRQVLKVATLLEIKDGS